VEPWDAMGRGLSGVEAVTDSAPAERGAVDGATTKRAVGWDEDLS
jgi:hypothetical protein